LELEFRIVDWLLRSLGSRSIKGYALSRTVVVTSLSECSWRNEIADEIEADFHLDVTGFVAKQTEHA
jgi:hypothetical protein